MGRRSETYAVRRGDRLQKRPCHRCWFIMPSFLFFLSILVPPSPGIFSRTTDVFVRKTPERNDYIGGSLHARERDRDSSPVIRVTLFCIIIIQKDRMGLACREDNSCFAPL